MSLIQRLSKGTLCNCCTQAFQISLRLTSTRATVTRINRPSYIRTYPTMLVRPDGSTITIRYKEPHRIIQLPLDLSTLTAEERQQRLQKRTPKKKITVVEEIDDNFDANNYSHLWKK